MTYNPTAEMFIRFSCGRRWLALEIANESLSRMKEWPDCDEKIRRIRLTQSAIEVLGRP